MLLRLLTFCLSICALSIQLHLQKKDPEYLLPKNVKPIRYNLTIEPNFSAGTFFGSVLIEIKALENSNYITLHVNKICMPPTEDIVVGELYSCKSLTVESAGTSNPTYNFFTISLSENLRNDTMYFVSIPNFKAKFGAKNEGFSNATFKDVDGSTRVYSHTQFEAVQARRTFPCFDEPALRAKFNVRLVRPNNQFMSASNGRLISQSTSAPYVDVYEETVDMPTYLLAFTISEMKFSETLDIYRIIARPEAINKNHHTYGLNLTAKVIDFMEKYTLAPFVLPKLDQIAIPYFPGGMENWGLIVYGEVFLLLTEPSNKEIIVPIVAHEVAHQWFGNLVGITWWKCIWLNEGFASYFEHLIPSKVEPDIDGRGLFIHGKQDVFQVDMRFDTRPLTENAELPSEIEDLFDRIAYKKGGAILQMLETALTQPVFQRGIQYYVKKMHFKQASPIDFYESLQRAVDETINTLPKPLTVVKFMSAWEFVKGFPVVDIRRNYTITNNTVTLTQKRYVLNPVGENGHWVIPINFATRTNPTFNNTDPEYWMTETQQTISVPNLNYDDWLIANNKATGYYRVNYDEINWLLIAHALITNHKDIHVLTRAQLIDDSMNLAKTGRLDRYVASKLVEYIQFEEDPIPWVSYLGNIDNLGTVFYYSPYYGTFKDYNFNITQTVYNYVGFDEKPYESNLKKDLRKIILNFLCKLDHPDCINKSLNKFKYWQKSKKNVCALEPNILCGAIRAGNQNDFDYLFDELQNINNSPINIVKGLSCSKNISNLYKLLQVTDKLSIDKMIEIVIDSGPEGLQAAINYLVQNLALIEEKFESKTGFLLRKLSEKISTDYQLNILKEAVTKSKYSQRFMKFFVDSEENILWNKHNLKDIAEKFVFKVSKDFKVFPKLS